MDTDVETKSEPEQRLLHWEKTYEFNWKGKITKEDRRTVILWAFKPDLEKVEFDAKESGYRIMLGDEVLMESGYFYGETRKLVEQLHNKGGEYASLRLDKWEAPAGVAIMSLTDWWPTHHQDHDKGWFSSESFEVRFKMDIPAMTVEDAAPFFTQHDINIGTFYHALFRLLVRRVAIAKKEGELEDVPEARILRSCRMVKIDKEQVACPINMGRKQPEDEDD